MTGLAAEILLIERLDGDASHGSYAARCHAGVLKVGDVLSAAVSPDGTRRGVDVKCTEIRLSEHHMVDQLEENYGGMVVLEGTDVPTLAADWTLSSE